MQYHKLLKLTNAMHIECGVLTQSDVHRLNAKRVNPPCEVDLMCIKLTILEVINDESIHVPKQRLLHRSLPLDTRVFILWQCFWSTNTIVEAVQL